LFMLPVPPPLFPPSPPPPLPATATMPAMTATLTTAQIHFLPPFPDETLAVSPEMSFSGVPTDSGRWVVMLSREDGIISLENDDLGKLNIIIISIMLTA